MIYPAQLNVFGSGLSPQVSYKYDRASSSWKKHFNIYDHLGTLAQTYKKVGIFGITPTSMQTHNPFGSERWTNSNLTETESTLLNWVSKEKDNESKLGDHGVRKYEYETGRFISIDPLWSSYYSWTPYQYSRNNPINALDISGGADFILNGGVVITDGIDDGLLFASNSFEISIATTISAEGKSSIDYEFLKSKSFQFPDKKTTRALLENHKPQDKGEAGSVGGLDFEYYGGRNKTMYPPQATEEVEKAFNMALDAGKLEDLTYYVHDHPNVNEDGRYVRSIKPSDPSDRSVIGTYMNRGAKNLKHGILFNQDEVNVFGTDKSFDIIFPRSILEEYSK